MLIPLLANKAQNGCDRCPLNFHPETGIRNVYPHPIPELVKLTPDGTLEWVRLSYGAYLKSVLYAKGYDLSDIGATQPFLGFCIFWGDQKPWVGPQPGSEAYNNLLAYKAFGADLPAQLVDFIVTEMEARTSSSEPVVFLQAEFTEVSAPNEVQMPDSRMIGCGSSKNGGDPAWTPYFTWQRSTWRDTFYQLLDERGYTGSETERSGAIVVRAK